MSDECANLPMCGFFKKYCDSNKAACLGFIKLYCKGEKRDDCERKKYRKLHNAPPPDEMMPSGAMVM
jgi:hypothetical protein